MNIQKNKSNKKHVIFFLSGQNEKVEPEPPRTITPVIPTSTDHTTEIPTKPTPAPTKPTTPSTTTTTTTTTTTPAPPTPPPTTPTTTTVAPTTTAAPSTTTKPTPKPKPEVGQWALVNTETNTTCLIVKMALEILVHYDRTDKQTGNATVIVPKKANFSGSCNYGNNNDTQQLTIMMGANNSDSITFNFARNETMKKFMLTSAEIKLTPTEDIFPMMKCELIIF